MENTWRYPSVQLESPTVQMAPPYYDNGTNSGNVDFSSSHNINRAMGAANDVVYQQSSWIPMQTVADFQMSVARISHIMRDGPRLPGYSLQSNTHYANYNAVPATQPSYQQSRWSAQPLQGHYPMVAANSLHVTTEDSGFSVVPQSYYAHSSSMPTPQLSQAQSSNWTPQSVVTEFPIDAVSRPQIKVENSGFLEFSHQPDEINHAPYSEAPETLSSNEQSSNWAPQSVETNFPVGAASTSHIKVENSGLSEFSHGPNESHTPYTEVPEAPSSNEQSSNWTAKSLQTNFPVGTASGTHIKVEKSGLSEFSYGPNESHAPYTEVPEAPSSTVQTSWMPPQAGFPTDTGSSAYIKTEDPGHSECSYQSGERTVESTVPTIQPSNEKDDFEVQESTVKFNQDVKERIPDHCRDGTSAASSSLAMEEREQEASTEQDGINKDHPQNPVSWSCPTCSQIFSNRDSLRSHKEIHSVTHWFMCNICLKTFAQKGYLRKHMKRHHSNNSTDEQGSCKESTEISNVISESNGNVDYPGIVQTNSSGISEIFQNGTQSSGEMNPVNVPYSCNICSKEFKQKRYLQRHYRNHHAPNREKFVCTVCDRVLATRRSLREHTNIHSKEKEFTCDKCERVFYVRTSLKNHKVSCHGTQLEREAGEVPSQPPEPIPCSICSREFTNQKKLQRHIRDSHSEKPQLPCSLCSKIFTENVRLKEHMNMHLKQRKFSCDLCARVYLNPSSLRTHRLTHTKPPPAPRKLPQCEICQHVYPNRTKLADHVRIHTLEKPFHCSICPGKFRTRQTLKWHRVTHSDQRPFLCNVCNKAFRRKSHLNEHVRTHDTNRIYKCKLCPETFQNSADRRRHRMTHPKPLDHREKQFVCSVCFKGFVSMSRLNQHGLTHVTVKPFACGECGKCFKVQRALRLHKLSHSTPRNYKCPICKDRAFHHNHVLQAHMRYFHCDSHDLKLFACHLCEKRYPSKAGLKEHVTRHSNEKPYTCDICSRSFYTSRNLRGHQVTHSHSRPHACDICDRAFKTKSMLRCHLGTHSNERHFLCEICGKNFTNKNGLAKHAVIHSETKPFVCEVCGKSCSRKDNLKTHMKVHNQQRQKKQDVDAESA